MTATLSPDEFRKLVDGMSPERRARLSQMVGGELPTVPKREVRYARVESCELERPAKWLEKDEQRECWRLLLACGFDCWWLSQGRKSHQTAGVPDLLAKHQGRKLILWLECKNPRDPAEWTPAQREFHRLCIADKETCLVGGEGVLRAWLTSQGFNLEGIR